MKKVHLSILCLVFSLASWALSAQEKAADIFVLSTHSESSEWIKAMLSPIQQLELERPEWTVSKAFLHLTSHPNAASLQRNLDSVLTAQAIRPRMVLMIGSSCFTLVPEVEKRWPDIPMLLIGENDYYCDKEYLLEGSPYPEANRYPVSNYVNQGLNVTLITAPTMIRRTMDMIIQVQPDLEEVFFIGGENFKSKECQWRWEEYMSRSLPDIERQTILSTETTTDKLIAMLEANKGRNIAAVYCSWTLREHYLEDIASRHQTLSLIERIVPTYSLNITDFEKHPYLVGLYSFSFEEYSRTVNQHILDILDAGIQPKQMRFISLQAGIATLNYSAFNHFGLDPSLIPEDAVILNEPPTLWSRHRSYVLWGIFCLIIGVGAVVFFVLTHSIRSMRKARNIAQQASKMKTAFIQNMSHEVRTPLNAIMGFSQLLCLPDDYLTEEEKADYLSNIVNNSQMLNMMLSDMMSIADIDSGRYIVNNAPVNINEMGRQAIVSVENRIPPGVKMVRERGVPDEARFVTDGMRIQQILVNFLTNACKYTQEGEITIGNSLTENPGQITFYVADTGPGVPEGMEESIFERFVKLDEFKQGSGLGLSICRMIAQRLGGKVWLDTSYKKGARFVLTIPKVEA